MQKRLNRSICHLGHGLGWAEGSTSSIIFARWRQCTRRQSAVSCAKMAEPIDLPVGLWKRPHRKAHWRHLANTTEASVCGGDAVLCQITLTTCYAALWNRAGHSCGFFFLSASLFFLLFPRLISAVGDCMSTSLSHMVWP